jgi:AcrR family transcriptional regulator
MQLMVRWEPDSPSRLQEAALTLFAERGYEETTVAAIAERAGVTERTFFRHYADKREVLFAGSDVFGTTVTDGVAAAPDDASPLEAVAAGLGAVAAGLDERRAFARRRAAVIDANRELRERELAKLDALTAEIARTLHARGVKEPAAGLVAATGMAMFRVAFERWSREDGEATLVGLLDDSFAQLRAVTASA